MKIQKTDNILITGAQGFVGKNLTEYLRSKGYENVIPIGREECDLIDQKQTLDFFQTTRPDYVFHAAGRVYGILGNLANKGMTFYDNTMININVVHGAYLAKVKKISAMGSGCVYPSPNPYPNQPFHENTVFLGRPHESENSYAQAKRSMLAMCEAYQENYDLDYSYIISGNIFGQSDNFDTEFGHVVPSLIKKFHAAKQSNSKISVWGNGSAQRDFIYIKDMVRGMLIAMEKISGPVNLASGTVYSIRDLVQILEKISGMQDEIVWDTTKPNGQDFRSYNIERMRSVGFQTKWTFQEGLQETWNWYCRHAKAKDS